MFLVYYFIFKFNLIIYFYHVNCYKEPERYYLDENNKIYKPCYSTCNKCNEFGDDINHNCIDCINGFEFKEFEKDYNCYEKCN